MPTTSALLLYDDKNIYVAFHCAQAGFAITAAQHVDHAGVGSDDHAGFFIDTSGNGSRTYEFRVNPLGIHDESSSENARYAPPWESIAHVGPNGDYDVLMVIPLSDIRAQAANSQEWRFNFERYIAAGNSEMTWAYQPAMQSISSVQFWPWLTNIHIVSSATRPKPQADVFALGSAGSQHNVFQNGVGSFEPMTARPTGIDVTYPFTNTLAFVGTLDPDFSNVDHDQTTILPTEFQRVYTEYRPFFAQGAQYINSIPQIGALASNSLFYTAPIGVFNRGLKIEGTSGPNAIGALNVVGPGLDDNALGYAYTTPDGSLGLGLESILANHTDERDDTTGFGFTRQNLHSGERTQIEYATEDNSDNGQSHDFNLTEGLYNQHFNIAAYYRDTSQHYDPLDGYTAVNDARGPAMTVIYNGTGSPRGGLQSYSFGLTADRYLATDGSVTEADVNGSFNFQFKNLMSLQGFYGPSELQVSPGVIQWFNQRWIQFGYKLSTPNPFIAAYWWGPSSGYYAQETQLSYGRPFGPYTASIEYDGNIERPGQNEPISNSQWLRRLTLSRSFGTGASIGIVFRSINGTGGFAEPGQNLSLLFQERFASQDLMYVEFGTPSATQTLHRFILKYVFHAGGGSGT